MRIVVLAATAGACTLGDFGAFKPLTCGASCSAPAIQFRRKGVLYDFSLNITQRTNPAQQRTMVRLANSALRAGPRSG